MSVSAIPPVVAGELHRLDGRIDALLDQIAGAAHVAGVKLDGAVDRVAQLEAARLAQRNELAAVRRRLDELGDQLSTLATVVAGLAGGDVDVDDYMAAHERWAASMANGGQAE